ncbi:MAG: cytochrome C assembly family protein [Terriglobia bacterium]
MHPALLWCALAFYGLGIGLTLPSVIGGRPRLSSASMAALSLGLLLHATALITAAIQLNHLPVADVQNALSFFAFDVTLAFFLAYLRYRVAWLGVFMLPFVFVFTLLAALGPDRLPSTGPFRGGWLVVHASSMILGYTGIFLTFVAALMYLIQENELKSKSPRGFYHRLPSLEVCVDLYDRSLQFGLLFLSIGILTGFLWASRAWQGPWELDPKVLASLLTWLIYLGLLSTRVSGNWRGRRSAYGAILGFAAVMVTFLGVSFLSGQHGYFPNLTHIP